MTKLLGSDDNYYKSVAEAFAKAKDTKRLYQKIVDLPYDDKKRVTMLSMGHVILVLLNRKNGTLDRIALSNTESAKGAVYYSVMPFKAIRVPVTNKENYIGIAIRTKSVMATSDWYYTFTPILTAEQARLNQAGGGIGCSIVYPLIGVGDGAALVYSFYEPLGRIGEAQYGFMDRYSSIATNELKNRQIVF